MSEHSENVSTNEESSGVKKKPSRHWLIWWDIDKDELKNQVDSYKKLSIWQSAKGQSALLLILSAIITTIFIIIGYQGLNSWGYFDVILFIILAFFIYKGHRWAIICAMILWTIEKIYMIFTTGGTGVFINIIWWAVYMSAFWLAFKVELERKNKKNNYFNKAEENKKVAFCSNCGKQIESNSKFCGNCGSSI